MGFLKKLFAGLIGGSSTGGSGIYVYVKVRRSGEIVQVRIHRGNEISVDDEGRRFCRKLIMGSRSFDRVEATFYFDRNYRLIDSELSGGELVSEDDYCEQQNPEAASS